MADRMLPYTRAVAILIVPFLVVAAGILYLLPTRTDELFAWTIRPSLTSMLLASAYIGGIWFFVRAAASRRWSVVRYGFPAVLLFATLASTATFLHWDRFHPWHLSFVVWVILYVTTPVLVALCILANWRRAPATEDAAEVRIPTAARMIGALIGAGAIVAGLTVFVAPNPFLPAWPWSVTPLTLRVVGAVLTLPGAVNLWLLVDARWSRFRLVVQSELVSLIAICVALLVCRDELRWGSPGAWLFAGGLAGSLVAFGAAYLLLERRRRAARGPERASRPPR